MKFYTRIRFFQKSLVFVLLLFMSTMAFVTVKCYSRQSGNTGMDMAKVQQMRYKANLNKTQIADNP